MPCLSPSLSLPLPTHQPCQPVLLPLQGVSAHLPASAATDPATLRRAQQLCATATQPVLGSCSAASRGRAAERAVQVGKQLGLLGVSGQICCGRPTTTLFIFAPGQLSSKCVQCAAVTVWASVCLCCSSACQRCCCCTAGVLLSGQRCWRQASAAGRCPTHWPGHGISRQLMLLLQLWHRKAASHRSHSSVSLMHVQPSRSCCSSCTSGLRRSEQCLWSPQLLRATALCHSSSSCHLPRLAALLCQQLRPLQAGIAAAAVGP